MPISTPAHLYIKCVHPLYKYFCIHDSCYQLQTGHRIWFYLLLTYIKYSRQFLITNGKLSSLTHRGRGKMAAILRKTFSNAIVFIAKLWVSYKVSLKYVPLSLNDNMSVLVRIMAWWRTGYLFYFNSTNNHQTQLITNNGCLWAILDITYEIIAINCDFL